MTIKKTMQGMMREYNRNVVLGIVTVVVILIVIALTWAPNG